MSKVNCPARKKIIDDCDDLLKQATEDKTKEKLIKTRDKKLRVHDIDGCPLCNRK